MITFSLISIAPDLYLSLHDALPISWKLDKAHAKLRFTITHLMVSEVDGWFKSFDAKVISSKDDFSDAMVEMTAEVDSISTHIKYSDRQLKYADFFDTENYPIITFKS